MKTAVKAQLEQDIGNYDIIKRFLTIYLATLAIPQYKRQRVEAYVRAIAKMAEE